MPNDKSRSTHVLETDGAVVALPTAIYKVGYNSIPLVPRWLLIVIGINLFWIVLLLDPQGF
jgi:hypothetical protein